MAEYQCHHWIEVAGTVIPCYLTDPVIRLKDDRHRIVVRRRQLEAGPFHCRVHGATRGELGLYHVSYNRRTSVTVPGGHTPCYLHLFRRGSGVYQFADGCIRGDTDHAVLLRSSEAYTASFSELEVFVLEIDRSFLTSECSKLRSASRSSPGKPHQRLDLRGGPGRIVGDLVNSLRFSLEEGPLGLLGSDLQRRFFASALVGALLEGQGDDRKPRLTDAGSKGQSQSLRIFEDFIEKNLHRPLSLGDLCEITGLGSRTLQRACLSRWGLSPLTYLAQRRLDRAQELLLRPRPGSTVAHIALSCGFSHLGRFAACYRDRFGVVPSVTLAQSQRCGRV
jgi:AraC-like DNA-binding protein